MYLLYLDDSGSVNNKNEEYFVLGGVCVPEQSVRWLTYELEKIAINIDKINPSSIEFHASEIFRGKETPWVNFIRKEQRIDIIKQVLQSVNSANQDVKVFACAIHKNSFPNQDPVLKAFEDVSSRFDLYLQRTNIDRKHKGLIILDKSSYEQGLQNLTKSIRQKGNQLGNQLRTLCEVPLFVDSRASRIVQLADHIAYAVFRRYEANDINYYNEIESRFDQDEYAYHGLSHLQVTNPHCSCPACLSRRNKPEIS